MAPVPAPPFPAPRPARRSWVEPLTALLMALVTVLTAWCSYQSASWTRRANRLLHDANALERRSGLLELQGLQSVTIHSTMFMQWLAARHAGNSALADFYLQRFPPDVRAAFDRWLAQEPFTNPAAAPHPFVPELYALRGAHEASELSVRAAAALADARAAGSVSGQYLANTVLFATVLFFAGSSGKFEQRGVRLLGLGFAVGVCCFAAFRLALLPR